MPLKFTFVELYLFRPTRLNHVRVYEKYIQWSLLIGLIIDSFVNWTQIGWSWVTRILTHRKKSQLHYIIVHAPYDHTYS